MRHWEGVAPVSVLCRRHVHQPSMPTSSPSLPKKLQIPQLVLGVTTIEEKKAASSAYI